MNNLGKYLLVILLFFVVASIGTMAVINSTDNSTSLNLTTIATTMNTHLKINIAPDAPTKWDMISVSGILTLDDNSTLANQSVSFFLGNESIGENFTDTSGVAHIDMDSSLLNAGDYIVSAEYVGNEQYSISYDQLSFSLQENTGENNTTENTTIENNTLENNTLENTTLENNTAQDNIVADQNNDIIAPVLPVVPFENTSANQSQDVIITQSQDIQSSLPQNVQAINDCINQTYEDEEPIIGTCQTEIMNCSDEIINSSCNNCSNETINNSCHNTTVSYSCQTGTQKVQKSIEKCITKKYIINQAVQLNIDGYKCSVVDEKTDTVFICDSIYDGNGDGICTSGESCMKFVIKGNKVEQYEKNSQDQFVQEDQSFFIDRASVEVLK